MNSSVYFLYTLGYGILEGTHPETRDLFKQRLENLSVALGRLWIIDIRKENCGSRNGIFFRQGIPPSLPGMQQLVQSTGALYTAFPSLSNEFGNTKKALENYRTHLVREISEPGGVGDDFCKLMGWVEDSRDYKIVLLCGCKDAFKMKLDGYGAKVSTGTHKCHRVPLSEVLKTYFASLVVVHL